MDLKASVKEKTTYKLPDILTPNNDSYSIQVVLGEAFKFVQFYDETLFIYPKHARRIGIYSIKLILTDEINPAFNTYALNINVIN